MKFSKSIRTVESHTMGEPTRIVIGGIPPISKDTMAKKKEYLENNLDHIRTALMHEPRGHSDMFGAIITAPTIDEADLGVVFMDGGGYLNMCGHGSIGTAAVAVETGMVEPKEPYTEVKMEAPAGLITAKVRVDDGRAKEVTMTNVKSFLYKEDVEIEVPKLGTITLDISFGGSFFAIVDSNQLGVKVEPSNADKLIDLGISIREKINDNLEISHPTKEYINTVDLVEIYDEPSSSDADKRNAVVFGQGQLDRSPCGTGTSAKLATLYAKEEIGLKEEFVYESIIGTKFKGEIIKEAKVGEFDAIVPQITGSAYITGFSDFVIDPEDVLNKGFCLN
ncbi:proline racemase [Sporohalobacter salinus]|uniref:proline racemase n=1 Tax=Sporohalobacter salinus TaxID=1494606 RepID=UPI00196062C0|nr:proline racemase [Sporohalobacter salinus]MBM7622538.1 proline racemase [Sporohalobacter salinus]